MTKTFADVFFMATVCLVGLGYLTWVAPEYMAIMAGSAAVVGLMILTLWAIAKVDNS